MLCEDPICPQKDETPLYNELIYAVARKYEGETRHQTALRYILERENEGGASESKRTAAGTADEKPDGQAENK